MKYTVRWTLAFSTDIIECAQDADSLEQAGLMLSDILASAHTLGIQDYLVESDIKEYDDDLQ
jgi:hypothetical protein